MIALAAAALITARATAQDSTETGGLCINARPTPRCGSILLTNYGVNAVAGNVDGRLRFRLLADWGILANVNRHSAVGASFVAAIDGDGFMAGPAVRYRRWSGDGASSIEVALGSPIGSTHNHVVLAPYGLIKWNPSQVVGFALRPELRQHTNYVCPIVDPYTCVPSTRRAFTISAGIEFAGVPGMIATGATTLVGAFLTALFVGGDY